MSAYTAREIMQDVAQRNKDKVVLTERDDTLMQRVVAFYNLQGTSNERMEAYYLLGSVYRDLHDAPKALEAFLNGISAADTVRKDCRYDILVRIYGQKNELLCKQKLFAQAIAEIPLISHYAVKAHDSLYVVDNWWKGLGLPSNYGDYKSIADGCWSLLEKSKEWGYYKYAAGQLNTSILANLELGRVDDAVRLMDIYEQESGDVDLGTYESTFPIYYYTKGRLLLALHKADSAEIFFRRELTFKDWNNRQAAYRGLREVFEQKGQKDSVSKYAVLQCEAVDSDYQAKLSEHLQDLHHLYDYSRAQQDSYQKELQLQEEKRQRLRMWWGIGIGILACAFLLYYVHTRYREIISEANLELERANTALAEKDAEMARLREELASITEGERKAELERRVKEAERESEAQLVEVMKREGRLDELRHLAFFHAKTLRQQYQSTPLFVRLKERAKNGKMAQPEDYEEIRLRLEKKDPGLMMRLSDKLPKASDIEMNVILLLKIGMRKSEIAMLTAHAATSVSSIVNRLYEKGNGGKPSNGGDALQWIIGA